MQKIQNNRGGFALPTVLLASVVMLIVLSVSVTSVVSVRTTLKTQYYEQLAKAAGEAGAAYAKACLAKNSNIPLWTDAKPLRPSTDCAGNEMLSPAVQVLVVAGGGGGGHNHGGGGGGGGVTYNNSFNVVGGQAYTVVVGSGGAGGNGTTLAGVTGGNSSFGGTVVANGGGGGGSRINTGSVSAALNGGSGGGGAGTINGATSQPAAGGTGISGQGFAGGSGSSGATAGHGGGGGGAGGIGGGATGITSGDGISGAGGIGYLSDISGSLFYYGAGGSGGRWANGPIGIPGLTGGGAGGNTDTTAGKPGLVNSGGGGGGGANNAPGGGAGGSGIVYVRYANNGTITATGGSVTPYVDGPYKVHAFKTTGSSTFTVSAATNSSCPTDPRCSVVVNDTLRSSFKVTRPAVDASGRALTIPNSGYVELLRASTGDAWRIYRQPSVQAAAVPDLCSGAAASTLGWQRAVVSAAQESIPNASAAQTITLTDGDLAAGKMYYRKDFTVFEPGTYSVSVLTSDLLNEAKAYVDGTLIDTARGSLASSTTSLSPGCHTLTIQVTNKTLTPHPARVTAAVHKAGSAPIVATDSSWRVSAGSTVHFSQSDFYADTSVWASVTDHNPASADVANNSWGGTNVDSFAQLISPAGNGCSYSCPANSSGYLRDSKDIYVASDTEVKISTTCDDNCIVYLDGEEIINSVPWPTAKTINVTLTPGYHRFGIMLYNSGVSPGSSKAALSVVDVSNGKVLTRTDRSWLGANTWTAGLNSTTSDIRSYEASFLPSPSEIPNPTTADVLVVGGGGGGGLSSGGGGGAGGVIYAQGTQLGITTYTVTVGAGGIGGTNSGTTITARGQNGGNSVFGAFTAVGGGGGASRDTGPAASSGGSGGGGSGTTAAGREIGAAGTSGQGNPGGNGTAADQGVAAKGGGGGGAGGDGVVATNTLSGSGGPGFISYLTGVPLTYAGGGAGGNNSSNGSLGVATDGGMGGSSTAAPANRGGGGSGAGAGTGGSGVVVIRIRTGSMAVTVTGAPAVTSATIQGVAYTIYTFNSSGTFRVTSIN